MPKREAMMVLQRDTKTETSLSKAVDKLAIAEREIYSNKPFALRLIIEAEKDLDRMKTVLRGGIKR